jgi:SAM-dependent methyltransferase
MTTFGAPYANLYDDLYADKDYSGECDRIDAVFTRHSDGAIARVLDLGCGTGNHAVRLADRGYDVTGVDRSPAMLTVARAKGEHAALRWIEGDVRSVDAGAPYDATLLLFAVMGYQHANDDVRATLSNARRHLRDRGLLLFDCWFGPAVLLDPPGRRTRVVLTPAGPIIRAASAKLDVRRHLCEVRYRLQPQGESPDPPIEESHTVRYFFPMEIELFLESAGFELVRLSAANDIDRDPDGTTWNVLAVARAV